MVMILLSTIIMIAIIFFAGICIEKLFKQQFRFSRVMMTGFLALLAAFQIIAYPMIRLNTSFSLLFWVFTCILLLCVVFAILLLFQTTTRKTIIQHATILRESILKEIPLLCITIGVLAFALFVSCAFNYETSDDSYYLAKSMEVLAQNRLGISSSLAWSGVEQTVMSSAVDASTLECWKAYWSYLFGMPPTVFTRNTFAFVVHIVSWCALYLAYQSVAKNKDKGLVACVFVLSYFLLVLMDNRLANNTAFWTIRYPGNGKSLLCSIIYPGIIYGCVQIVDSGKNPIPWQKWAMLSLVFTAGIASSIVGVFWPFLCCLTMGIPYLIIERRKDLHKLFLPLVLTCLPVVLYAGLSYFTIATEHSYYFSMATPTWSSALSDGLNVNRIDVLLICLLFTLIFGSRSSKLVLAGGCITLFATFANPVFMGFVSKYLTTGSVYFRLFWMVPVYFLPAFVAAEMVSCCKLQTRQVAAWVCLAFLILAGGIGIFKFGPRELYQYINERTNLTQHSRLRSNLFGLDNLWYEVGDHLLKETGDEERIRILWLHGEECHLRQYSERIEVIGGCRESHWNFFKLPLENGAAPPLLLKENYFHDNRQNFDNLDWAHEQMLASNIDYICVDIESNFAKSDRPPDGFALDYEIRELKVYRVLDPK